MVYGNVVKEVLTHPSNTIEPQTFLNELQKREPGETNPLLSLCRSALSDVLKIAKVHSIPIDLHTPDPIMGQSLSTKWTKYAKEVNFNLVELMADVDPQIIPNGILPLEYFFTTAVLKGEDKKAAEYLKKINKDHLPLSLKGQWISYAYGNNGSLTD